MDAPAPFTAATPSSCRMAWTGGNGLPPLFQWWPAPQYIDGQGFHVLVRAAGLPEAELRRMGFTRRTLSPELMYVAVEEAVTLLGRIAWDALAGNEQGYAWRDSSAWRRRERDALGLAVVKAWFKP